MKVIKTILCTLVVLPLGLSLTGCVNSKDNIKYNNTSENTQRNDKTSVELTISAAASLKEAMADIETEYSLSHPEVKLTFNFGSSGSLQKQIEQGAPCDLFISAGQSQMKSLYEENLLLEDTNKNLVKNQLVLIGPKDTNLKNVNDLVSSKVKHIAIGEPTSVPAGKYADEALTSMKIKDSISEKLTFAKDVKEVLAWTISGNAEAGFVYKSDALSSEKSKIIEIIPEDKHSPITYPVAVLKESKNPNESKTFENFLFSDKCKSIFEKYGYEIA